MTRAESAIRREQVKRLLRHWDTATAADLERGLQWYGEAGELASALAAGAPITREQAAGVIAALSPRCGWSTNVQAAVKLVDAYAAGATRAPVVAGLPDNRRKAWAVLQHDGDPLDVLRGPKVRSFYRNICGDTDAVTIDIWAARAAEGPRWRDRAPEGARYDQLRDAYRRAADIIGVSPRDLQAAVWTKVRREQARAIFDINDDQGAS